MSGSRSSKSCLLESGYLMEVYEDPLWDWRNEVGWPKSARGSDCLADRTFSTGNLRQSTYEQLDWNLVNTYINPNLSLYSALPLLRHILYTVQCTVSMSLVVQKYNVLNINAKNSVWPCDRQSTNQKRINFVSSLVFINLFLRRVRREAPRLWNGFGVLKQIYISTGPSCEQIIQGK